MRLRYIIVSLLYPCFSLCAQKTLSIGDTVPDIEFAQLINYPSKTARLSDFKDKLVILDFWATWCGSCLHAMPKMDSLQRQYGDKLQVVLINSVHQTRDDSLKVSGFFRKWKDRTGTGLCLPSVVNDTLIAGLFQHWLIPHYVWIGKDRKVMAITSSDGITARNLEAAFNGIAPALAAKKDQDMDRPIFSGKDLVKENLVSYAILVKGWFDGLPRGNKTRETNNLIYGRAMTNTTIWDMYQTIASLMEPSITDKQVIADVKDTLDLLGPTWPAEDRDKWYKEHAFTLDVIVPKAEASRLYERVLEVINRNSGFKGQFEKKKTKCWVLQKKNTAHHLQSNGGETENRLWDKDNPHLKNTNISALLGYLNSIPAFKEIVINETGYKGNIDLETEGGFSDLNEIQRNLSKNGFVLKQKERLVKVFVVRKN
ncbi:MAG: TlpA family protein disulfide reductase [Flavisolibacter sp.]